MLVLWRISPLFVDWMASSNNFILKSGFINPGSTVLELGCGISGLVAMNIAPRVRRYIATDQEYVFKTLRHNLDINVEVPKVPSGPKSRKRPKAPNTALKEHRNIETLALDWESSSLQDLAQVLGITATRGSLDMVVACDCVYNETLVDPLVRTCAELCQISIKDCSKPTICVIAQQLRSYSVFEAWLLAFHKLFRVWRVPDELLTPGLRTGSGFVVHVGIWRNGA